jgi:hypothetical protein
MRLSGEYPEPPPTEPGQVDVPASRAAEGGCRQSAQCQRMPAQGCWSRRMALPSSAWWSRSSWGRAADGSGAPELIAQQLSTAAASVEAYSYRLRCPRADSMLPHTPVRTRSLTASGFGIGLVVAEWFRQ